MRQSMVVALALVLAGCASERHFARDGLPFGNPNGPIADSETAQRALGHQTAVTPIAPQAGNVWPGPVQPVPTIADEQKAMTQPLGNAYTPSLPSPYPPGVAPPPDPDLGSGPLGEPGSQTFSIPAGSSPDSSDMAPLTGPLGTAPLGTGPLGSGAGGQPGAGQ